MTFTFSLFSIIISLSWKPRWTGKVKGKVYAMKIHLKNLGAMYKVPALYCDAYSHVCNVCSIALRTVVTVAVATQSLKKPRLCLLNWCEKLQRLWSTAGGLSSWQTWLIILVSIQAATSVWRKWTCIGNTFN